MAFFPSESNIDVASSKIIYSGSNAKIDEIAIHCFSPPDKL